MTTPAPAPAEKPGERKRAVLCFAGGVLHLDTGGKSRLFIGDDDVPLEYDEDGNAFISLDRTEIEFLRDRLNEYLPTPGDRR